MTRALNALEPPFPPTPPSASTQEVLNLPEQTGYNSPLRGEDSYIGKLVSLQLRTAAPQAAGSSCAKEPLRVKEKKERSFWGLCVKSDSGQEGFRPI